MDGEAPNPAPLAPYSASPHALAPPPLQAAGADNQPVSTIPWQQINQQLAQLRKRERHLPFAAPPGLAEPLLTKNELGTNSSSESESAVGGATALPSNRLRLSLAGGEGGGEGDGSTGVDDAEEPCRGAPAGHKDKHKTEKKIMNITLEAHGTGARGQNKTRIDREESPTHT